MNEDLDLISDLQQNNQKLLDQNDELKKKINSLISENLTLTQQAAKANSLQEQLDRLLKEEPIFIQPDHPGDAVIETLQNRVIELTKELDEYAQDASDSKMYRDLVKQKDEQIKSLTQQLCDAKAEAHYANQIFSTQNLQQNSEISERDELLQSITALKASIAEYSHQNSELNRKNVELQNRNANLSSQIASHEMQIKVLKQENIVLNQATSTPNLLSSQHTIQQRIEEISNNIFRNAERKITDLETKIQHLEQKLANFSNTDNVEELQMQLDFLLSNDKTAELAFALSQLEQLKLENESLKAKLQKKI